MAKADQLKKKINKHERTLQSLYNELHKLEEAALKKAIAQPVTLKECMQVYSGELQLYSGYLRRADLLSEVEHEWYTFKREATKESRPYFKEICQHLLEGGKVRIRATRYKFEEYSNIHRYRNKADVLFVKLRHSPQLHFRPKPVHVRNILGTLRENRINSATYPELTIEFL